MEDEKKKYTFTDKRGRSEDASAKRGERPQDPSPRQEAEGAIDFSTLIMSFASAAMISMGSMPDPVTGQIVKDLALAKQNIDIISLLKEKTRGNLTGEEDALLEGILYELRMSFVQAQKG
ncbi:MAG TPA: DUF1844 domain-containing protein [Deltaproteobacteria bacterium]|jgi:hypothetical protein|nr:DUF1844 domain-containing protein [Deltaproteobacteria bacterium]HOI07759.1 DUF1844 domain-containing protein [Deltaproteobacteria bacterium]